jgi:hypothetical protein
MEGGWSGPFHALKTASELKMYWAVGYLLRFPELEDHLPGNSGKEPMNEARSVKKSLQGSRNQLNWLETIGFLSCLACMLGYEINRWLAEV